MPRPEDCYYTKEHEWIHIDGEEVTVGVTDFAQQELGDIVYVELKEAGTSLGAGDELGTIESVKAVAEVYAPVAAKVVRVNAALGDRPETINQDPFGEGWLAVLQPHDIEEVKRQMSQADYANYLESEQK